jgi:hypothetical protein
LWGRYGSTASSSSIASENERRSAADDRADRRCGNNAVAGWVQGEMGDRALLRKKGGRDGIKAHEALVKAGISSDDAATLERELAMAEGKLSPEQVAMLSRFEGILMMDNSGNHPSAHHQSHAKH